MGSHSPHRNAGGHDKEEALIFRENVRRESQGAVEIHRFSPAFCALSFIQRSFSGNSIFHPLAKQGSFPGD